MRITKPSSEREMVYEFLRMELTSDRFAARIEAALREAGADRRLITDGDIADEEENALRAEVLGRFRGFGQNRNIFERFPAAIDWHWSVFDREDMPRIRFVNYSFWNELSDYTGSPLAAVKTILSGRTVYDCPNEGFIEAYQALRRGCVFPPLIMLTDGGEERFILLEGHKRMTAYAFEPALFYGTRVLLGYCGQAALADWYGVMPAGRG